MRYPGVVSISLFMKYMIRKIGNFDENYFNRRYNFQETLFLTTDEYILKRIEFDNITINSIKGITVEDLNKILGYKNTEEKYLRKKLND
jgi:hypothetical protein